MIRRVLAPAAALFALIFAVVVEVNRAWAEDPVLSPSPAPAIAPSTPPGTDVSPRPPAVPASEPPPRYPLRPTEDGGYDYSGSRFSARIAPDGSVALAPRRLVVEGPGPLPEPTPERPTPYDQPIKDRYRDPPLAPVPQPIFIAGGVRFDATDEYRRLLGDRPERDAEADFLAATFELRIQMAAHHQRRQVDLRLQALPGELAAIWTDPARSRAQKLGIIEALWQELGDGPDAARAADTIETFARRNMAPEEAARFER
jgi:hypothetical protein